MKYRIREMRKKRDMSQAKLSEKSGVSRSIISNLEYGTRRSTTMDTLERIAKALNVTVKDLIDVDRRDA